MKFGNHPWVLKLFAFAIFLATLIITLPQHAFLHSRDKILESLPAITQYQIRLSAEEFCRLNLKEQFSIVPCTTIDSRFFSSTDSQGINDAVSELSRAIASYESLQAALNNDTQTSGQLLELQAIVQRKLAQLSAILNVSGPKSYPALFKGLLIAQGTSYNTATNKFKLLPQNIAQYILGQNNIQRQYFALEKASQYLAVFYLALLLVCLLIIRKKLSGLGLFFLSIYFFTIFFGLNLIRDASLHFGFESASFDLSPFRQLYQRQLVVTLLSAFILVLCIRFSHRIANTFTFILNRLSITLGTLLCTLAIAGSYLLLGPAIGSELFKVSSCFIAAFLLYRYGRTLELAQEQFGLSNLVGKSLSYLGSFTYISIANKKEIFLQKYYVYFLFWKILIQILLVIFLLLLVSAIFHDLGGSLIAGLVFSFCLFVLLGKKFASLLIGLVSILGVSIFIVSEKVQNRFELMLNPKNANISDFERLIQFENAGQPFGFGLGNIKWCSADGVCLPLQTLSDYMPTLINGAFGKIWGLLLLGGLAYVWIILAYQGFIASWLYKEPFKFAKLFGSLLCLAALFQLFVTTLGNLRIIPLTGLGTPLISIGISSSISASIGFGLILGLCYARK